MSPVGCSTKSSNIFFNLLEISKLPHPHNIFRLIQNFQMESVIFFSPSLSQNLCQGWETGKVF